MHECFHAYLFGKLFEDKLHNGLCPEPNFKKDFEAYNEKYYGQEQHNYMADRYLHYLKEGLREYFMFQDDHSGFLNYVKNHSYWCGTDFLLESLTWGGLHETDAWKSFYSDATNKQKI